MSLCTRLNTLPREQPDLVLPGRNARAGGHDRTDLPHALHRHTVFLGLGNGTIPFHTLLTETSRKTTTDQQPEAQDIAGCIGTGLACFKAHHWHLARTGTSFAEKHTGAGGIAWSLRAENPAI